MNRRLTSAIASIVSASTAGLLVLTLQAGSHPTPAALTAGATATPATSLSPVVISGCLTTAHALTRVTTGTPLACPSGAAAVNWPGQAVTTPSASPSASSTTPTGTATPTDTSTPTATPTVTPSATATGMECVTSAANGHCPFGPVAYITGNTSDPYVDNNVWSPVSGWQQTLTADSPGSWHVAADMPTGNTSVVSFPNAGAGYSGSADSFSTFSQSFTESMPHNAATSGWAMDDLWFNNWADEVMIQYDFSNNGDCTVAATATFSGQPWHLCDFGGGTMAWKLGSGEGTAKQSESSGTIDILAMIRYLETNGYLPAASTWTAWSAGFEICSTGSQNETWGYSSLSVSAS